MQTIKYLILSGFTFWLISFLGDYTDGSNNPEQLAKTYCSTCHLFPEPHLLDKNTWKTNVLPNMGARLGIQNPEYDPYENMVVGDIPLVMGMNIYPEEQLISDEDWADIVQYYVENAPDSLENIQDTAAITGDQFPFEINLIDIGENQIPKVTLLEYDNENGVLYIGDNNALFALNTDGEIIGSWETPSPTVDIVHGEIADYVMNIGSFAPSDRKEGMIFPLLSSDQEMTKDHIITELPRPVHMSIADLNSDGNQDIVICGFGNHQGELAWYNDFNEKHVISHLPGARKTEILDMNGDGFPDIVALMAQSWEKLIIFYNDGAGNFTEETVLTFSALHGVSYFELKDINGDGFQDVILTNGDNWDYSSIKKPYHGVHIFLNNGENKFAESFFYPMNGCSKAVAEDFDGDGDYDIAAISFYDHLDNPTKSFVYLEQTEALNFEPRFMKEAANGKWLTMDTGDFNLDGKQDIFLGSYFHNMGELGKVMLTGVFDFPQILLLTFKN